MLGLKQYIILSLLVMQDVILRLKDYRFIFSYSNDSGGYLRPIFQETGSYYFV